MVLESVTMKLYAVQFNHGDAAQNFPIYRVAKMALCEENYRNDALLTQGCGRAFAYLISSKIRLRKIVPRRVKNLRGTKCQFDT